MLKDNKMLVGALVLFNLLFAYSCYLYQVAYPPCCDATAYETMAKIFSESGIVRTASSDVRPYGYPLLMATILRACDALNLQFSLTLFLVQTILYGSVSAYLANFLYDHYSRTAGISTFVGLLGNALLLPALGIALTDGFSVIVQIAIVITLVRMFFLLNQMTAAAIARHFFALGAFSGLAVVVRPGNVHFALFESVALVLLWHRHRTMRRTIWFALAIGCLGFSVLVLPQVLSNWKLFQNASFLPVYDFQGKQLLWGQEYLKYGTSVNVSGQGVAMPYVSPWASTADGSLWWYFRHPVIGSITIVVHLFGALDFDHLFTYVHNAAPSYRLFTFTLSQSIAFWGVIGWYRIYQSSFNMGAEGRDLTRIWLQRVFFIVSMTYVASWLAVYSLSAVENRYAFPLITLFMPVALLAVYRAKEFLDFRKLIVLHAAYILVAAAASVWISSLKVT